MYEIVKTVKGYDIERMIGTHGHYIVKTRPNVYATFRTIKAAAAYIENNL